jgi:hypothetical protein
MLEVGKTTVRIPLGIVFLAGNDFLPPRPDASQVAGVGWFSPAWAGREQITGVGRMGP